MLETLHGAFVSIRESSYVSESPVFRVTCGGTTLLLITCSIIITMHQYVGNPIDCVHTRDLPDDVLNTYCWSHSTFSSTPAFQGTVGVEVPYPGVGNSQAGTVKYTKYYQWCSVVLFIQQRSLTKGFLAQATITRKGEGRDFQFQDNRMVDRGHTRLLSEK
uniref:Innexin n=1 Tax=Timema genevievae TaxID=629358 RepID=A0A7R9JMV0_TIMGE|nr:unnamed protein product [Timema genevievae]